MRIAIQYFLKPNFIRLNKLKLIGSKNTLFLKIKYLNVLSFKLNQNAHAANKNTY